MCLGVFSGKSETKRGKSEIYFGFGAFVVLLSSSFVVAVVVSTECRWCAPAPSLWVCSVPFSLPLPSFLLCLWCIAFEYGFISHFRGVFGGFWGADVYLYGFGSLRGLWGFCVRERLGGFGACCVFRLSPFVFLSALLSSCSCPASLLGFFSWSYLAFLALWVWLLAFFPFRTASEIKRRGAYCVPSCGACLLSFC